MVQEEGPLTPTKIELDDKYCYDLKSLGLDKRTTLVLSNTRELDRVPKTK